MNFMYLNDYIHIHPDHPNASESVQVKKILMATDFSVRARTIFQETVPDRGHV